MSKRKQGFLFSKYDEIGASDAADDIEYLSKCFINTGDLTVLRAPTNRRIIILGRTGSGKTALLKQLHEEVGSRVIEVSPENLALSYISNSRVINFFDELGVALDPFFKLLWRHVFFVEALKAHFDISDETKQKSIFARLKSQFNRNTRKDKNIKKALEYVEKNSGSFWEESHCHAKEITKKFEEDLNSSAGAKIDLYSAGLNASVGGRCKVSEEEKYELRNLGQQVVNDAQIADLRNIEEVAKSVLEDPQKCYYIIIDRLDLNWVEDKLRYKLIMALIDTAKEFISINNIKVIFTMRRDLIDRVFRLTRNMGFQEEKYTSLYLPLHWTKNDLMNLLNKRISVLASGKGIKREITYKNLLPATVKSEAIEEYVFQRARRPRDIIDLFNRCIQTSADQSKISITNFKVAEGEYSIYRLRSLGDEWQADYPSLLDFTELLFSKPQSFKLSAISYEEIESKCLETGYSNLRGIGILQTASISQVNGDITTEMFLKILIQAFYKVGLIGLKPLSQHKPVWADDWQQKGYVIKPEINDGCSVVINPAYYRALGIKG